MIPLAPSPPHTDSHDHDHSHGHLHVPKQRDATQAANENKRTPSVLAWPAWLRIATVLPLVLVLWLAVWWANEGVALW
jgi:hypothetical protein